MPTFRSGLPADRVHARLKESLRDLQLAEKNAVLWFAEIMQRQLYRELGYSSIHIYAQEALGFSKGKTSQFVRLAEALDDLPALRGSLASGELGWTKAREVIKVATPRNEKRWLDEACRSSRRQLERKVAHARAKAKATRKQDPNQGAIDLGEGQSRVQSAAGLEAVGDMAADLPVSVTLRFAPEQFARFEAMMEKIRKQSARKSGHSAGQTDRPAAAVGAQASREEIVLAALEEMLVYGGGRGGEIPAGTGSVEAERTSPGRTSPGRTSPGRTSLGQTSPSRTRQATAESDAGLTGPSETSLPDNVSEFTRVNSRAGGSSPYQIIVYRCKQCGGGHVQTTQGRRRMSAAALGAVACDAKVQDEDGRNRSTIPPARRRTVLARDGHRCRVKGCHNSRFLEVHHRIPRSRGGGNDMENLITVCASCHQLLHARRTTVQALVE